MKGKQPCRLWRQPSGRRLPRSQYLSQRSRSDQRHIACPIPMRRQQRQRDRRHSRWSCQRLQERRLRRQRLSSCQRLLGPGLHRLARSCRTSGMQMRPIGLGWCSRRRSLGSQQRTVRRWQPSRHRSKPRPRQRTHRSRPRSEQRGQPRHRRIRSPALSTRSCSQCT